MLKKRITQLLLGAIMLMQSTAVMAGGKVIEVPQGYDYGTIHTYTIWDEIIWGDSCKQLLDFANENQSVSNTYGIVKYGEYFCGALTSTYGEVGDLMLVVSQNNIVYPVIMADTKDRRDANCNMWGHQYGKCIVEFEILSEWRESLYGTSGGYISSALANPILRVINLGSVYEDDRYFNNPRRACIDYGLYGYTLLINPYGGSKIEGQRMQRIPSRECVLKPNQSRFPFSLFNAFNVVT